MFSLLSKNQLQTIEDPAKFFSVNLNKKSPQKVALDFLEALYRKLNNTLSHGSLLYRMFEFNVKIKRVNEANKMMDCIALGL
jgi:hypothetical protein